MSAGVQLNNDTELVSISTPMGISSQGTKVSFMQQLNLNKSDHLSTLTYWVIREISRIISASLLQIYFPLTNTAQSFQLPITLLHLYRCQTKLPSKGAADDLKGRTA